MNAPTKPHIENIIQARGNTEILNNTRHKMQKPETPVSHANK